MSEKIRFYTFCLGKGYLISISLTGQLAHVNIIPVNPIAERNLNRPSDEQIGRFCNQLERYHISATVRREMGGDINAACGQLRNRHINSSADEGNK